MLVLHKISRIVQVDILIRVAVGHIADVVHAAQTDSPSHALGVSQCKIHRVIRAEARPGRDQERIGILVLRQGQHLIAEIGIVLRMSPGACRWMPLLRIPARAAHDCSLCCAPSASTYRRSRSGTQPLARSASRRARASATTSWPSPVPASSQILSGSFAGRLSTSRTMTRLSHQTDGDSTANLLNTVGYFRARCMVRRPPSEEPPRPVLAALGSVLYFRSIS